MSSARPVIVGALEGDASMKTVRGGFLPSNIAWLPDNLKVVNGKYFITLHACSHYLAGLCGKRRLTACNELGTILTIRNTGCEKLIKEMQSSRESVQGTNARGTRVIKKEVCTNAPDEITLTIPSPDGGPDVNMQFLFEMNAKTCPSMELTATNLDFFIKLVRISDFSDTRGRKRTIEERISFNFPEVACNYQRGTAQIRYRDSDGRLHAKSLKPPPPRSTDTAADQSAAMQACATELHGFYVEHHHPLDDDDEDSHDADADDNEYVDIDDDHAAVVPIEELAYKENVAEVVAEAAAHEAQYNEDNDNDDNMVAAELAAEVEETFKEFD
jgi:hypothetical protein